MPPETTPSDPAAVLAQWQADATELHARSSLFGVSRSEQVTGMTGLQLFEAMLAGQLPRAPITETLDFTLIAASYGRAVFQGRPPPRHYNPLGTSTAAGSLRCSIRRSPARCIRRCRPARPTRRRN